MIFGLLLCFMSVAVGVAHVDRNGREVGYVFAPNWSLALIIIVPALIHFVLSAYQDVTRVVNSLEQKRMLANTRREPWSLGRAATLHHQWNTYWSHTTYVLVAAMLIALFASMLEFYFNSAVPLATGDVQRMAEPAQADWDVGSLLNGNYSHLSRAANMGFTFVAYLGQTFVVSVILTLVALIFAVAVLIYQRTKGNTGLRLVPSLISDDPRLGFEVFEFFLTNVLYALLTCFLLLYCARIQNIYLRSSHSSLFQFLQKDIVQGFAHAAAHLGKLELTGSEIRSLFAVDGGDYTSMAALIGGVVALLAVGVFLILLLRNGAIQCREAFVNYIAQRSSDFSTFTDDSEQACLEKLKNMHVWPFKYPKPNQLLVLFAIGIFTLICYKVGLFLFGILLFVIIRRAVLSIMRLSRPA
jgi:hypothetical protein